MKYILFIYLLIILVSCSSKSNEESRSLLKGKERHSWKWDTIGDRRIQIHECDYYNEDILDSTIIEEIAFDLLQDTFMFYSRGISYPKSSLGEIKNKISYVMSDDMKAFITERKLSDSISIVTKIFTTYNERDTQSVEIDTSQIVIINPFEN